VPDLAPQPGRPAGDRISLRRQASRRSWRPPDMPAGSPQDGAQRLPGHHAGPEFIEDAKRNMLDVAPEDGRALAALIQKVHATPSRSWTRSAS